MAGRADFGGYAGGDVNGIQIAETVYGIHLSVGIGRQGVNGQIVADPTKLGYAGRLHINGIQGAGANVGLDIVHQHQQAAVGIIIG